jgi:hypothetical protein
MLDAQFVLFVNRQLVALVLSIKAKHSSTQNYATYRFCSLAETVRSETKTKTAGSETNAKTKTVKTLSRDSLEARQCLET